jgi:hypothetical protein
MKQGCDIDKSEIIAKLREYEGELKVRRRRTSIAVWLLCAGNGNP